MGQMAKQTLHQRYTDDKQAYENISTEYVIRERQTKTVRNYYVSMTMAKTRILMPPNVDRDKEHWELSLSVHGHAEWHGHFRRELGNFLKNKNILLRFYNCNPWYLCKGVESICPYWNLHVKVYFHFIHNCQTVEVTKIFIGR